MTKSKKFKILVYNVVRLFVLGAGILSILRSDWLSFGLTLLILVLTFLPYVITRKISIQYPSVFEIFGVVFIYASLYLGEFHSFYEKFWWWDVVLHISSSLVFAAFGLALVYTLNKKKVTVNLSPYFVVLFAFTFAITIGTLWEIIEYAIDNMFGLNMQKSGLQDTMWDLIVDATGAFVVSWIGYYFVEKKVNPIKNFFKKY